MFTNKLNIEQTANLNVNETAKAVVLVYATHKKDGSTVERSIRFDTGKAEAFEAWKAVVELHWTTKLQESVLRLDNAGISTKLRTSTPVRVYICGKVYNVEGSVWSRIGLTPSKKDIERLTPRELKKQLHKAAVASARTLGLAPAKKETVKESK